MKTIAHKTEALPLPLSWREKFLALPQGECIEVTNENLTTVRAEITRLHHNYESIQVTMRTIKDTGKKYVWRLK